MSGGIDSSIASVLLQEQNFQLEGITLRVWDYISESCLAKQKGCCSVEALFEAKKLSEKLGFEHHTADVRDDFKNFVIKNFIDEYLAGHTPNPCVLCNPFFKWDKVLAKADELNCFYIATGHYARIRHENERYILSKGNDIIKDQSYFLWQLSQKQLERTLFPLGQFTKPEIRQIAQERGFKKLTEKRESQEICFVQKGDYRQFLNEQVPGLEKKVIGGNFVDTNGKILGKHKGYPYYTIGQRKGLNIAVGHPLYVIEINPDTNTIVLGEKQDLLKNELWAKDINLIKYPKLKGKLDVDIKIRYRTQVDKGIIEQKNDKIFVKFIQPVTGITPGQSAVFYEGEDVIGGGIIMHSNELK